MCACGVLLLRTAEYVKRYVDFVLNTSIVPQFEPFKKGFYHVCGGNALTVRTLAAHSGILLA